MGCGSPVRDTRIRQERVRGVRGVLGVRRLRVQSRSVRSTILVLSYCMCLILMCQVQEVEAAAACPSSSAALCTTSSAGRCPGGGAARSVSGASYYLLLLTLLPGAGAAVCAGAQAELQTSADPAVPATVQAHTMVQSMPVKYHKCNQFSAEFKIFKKI